MTREEAIDLLDNLIGAVEDNHGSDYDEALKIAIKALEREPCEDCISRQDVLDYAQTCSLSLNWDDDLEIFCDEIKELPSVIPQPKIGHWIYTGERSDWYDVTYKCSCCGKMIIVPYEVRNEIYTTYPYCCCGAKMEAVEND